MQKMRRTSGHVSLVCALLLAGAVTPAWSKPSKPATKAAAQKTAKNQAVKSNSTAANRKGKAADKKTASATPTAKKGAKAPAKGSAHADAAPAGRNNKQARANNITNGKTVAVQSKNRGKNEEKNPSSKDLHKQIAALQAKGKGKGRQLSKTQKQQLARLMAQAQQAEKLERQEKMEQARALRLAAAQRERQQQQAKALLAARATAIENTAPAAIPQPAPQQPVVANTALQEDLMALHTNGSGTSNANGISSAQAAAAVAAAPSTPAIAPGNAPYTPTSPAATAAATQEDPLQALLAAKLASPSAPTAATASATVEPTAPAAAIAPAAPVARAAAPIVLSSPAPATPSAPAVAAAAATALERKPEAAPSPIIRVSLPQRGSLGQIQGLSPATRSNFGPELYSNVAFAMDQKTGQVLVNKNGHFVSPVASITKLMTAVITMDANLPMDEMITITDEDVDRLKGSRSRLAVGTTMSRQELLHLALMSSENRAAHALGRTYPGGLGEAIRAMNRRALMLGMRDTRYVEPTGLSSANHSSAHDLALLVKAAYRYPLIRNYTTYPGAEFAVQGQMMRFNNTNRLIHSPEWNIGLQKTGYISEAGRCVVMQSNIGGRNVIIVLLDSAGTNRRAQDAEAIRYWVQQGGSNRLDRDGSSIIAQARTY